MMYLPDEIKAEVEKFFQTTAGKVWLEILKQNLPLTPDLGEQLHTVATKYAYREGAERMLEEVRTLHLQEDAMPKPAKKHKEEDVRSLTPDEIFKIVTNPAD